MKFRILICVAATAFALTSISLHLAAQEGTTPGTTTTSSSTWGRSAGRRAI